MEHLVLDNSRQCRYCGNPLRGRTDKLYCDITCKNAFHNQHQQNDRRDIEQIDRILKQNRIILKTILGDRTTAKVFKAELMQRGLRFEFHTHEQRQSKNRSITCCYEYGYVNLDKEKTLVVRLKKT